MASEKARDPPGTSTTIRIEEGVKLEIHFSKPVIAKVRKCRLVVVKSKRPNDENGDSSEPK